MICVMLFTRGLCILSHKQIAYWDLHTRQDLAHMDAQTNKRIQELVQEEISIASYDPAWPMMFKNEAAFLRRTLPGDLVKRIEHFGSTAVPGLSAKPIIDILVEVASLEKTRKQIVPILESERYEYFWRPAFGDDGPPYYAWFIRRNPQGKRVCHIHMVEADSGLWDRLYFRDYLREFESEARKYGQLKIELAEQFPNDRVAYTNSKAAHIVSVTEKAKLHYLK